MSVGGGASFTDAVRRVAGDRGPTAIEGRIASSPVNRRVDVLLRPLTGSRPLRFRSVPGAVPWPENGGTVRLPQRNDRCWVAFDEADQPVIVAWEAVGPAAP
jgi:hypothetical protein